MKRNTPEHPKTLALMKALGLSRLSAIGLLEALWHFTARYAPQGDIGRWPDDHIANGVYWEGDPAVMLAGLVASGWLDECDSHRYVIHDWADHMDEATKKALMRKDLKPARVSRQRRTTADNGGNRQPAVAVAVARALPEPEPLPDPLPPAANVRPTCDHAFARKRFAETGRSTVCVCGEEFRSISANPFVGDKRPELERESLRLAAEIAAIVGDDPAEVFAQSAHYDGAKRQKLNPATMSDDRLLATVRDLRANLKAVQSKRSAKAAG